MSDPLYARLNARGRKQFKDSESIDFEESYPEYGKIGLPAHKAALDGNVSCLRDIFISKHQKDEGVPSRDVNGATPMHLASRTNRIEVIRWLLRFTDLSPVMTAKHGETPAHVAAAQGNVDCLKVMVSAEGKSDIKSNLSTAVDNSGYTALHLAIVKFRNDCAKLLIAELGPKGVGALNESGITAAHVAASSGNVDILRLLSQKHKKLMSQRAADGTTPVYFAAQEGRLDALKFLATKLKCDLMCDPSNDGLQPIHAAAQCGHTHIVKFLVAQLDNQAVFDKTPDGATPLHFSASSGQVATARWLLNCDLGGSLIGSKDKNGDTAAHDAADGGQTAMLKFLLESGADLYAINNEGNTPYSLALSGQDTEMANFVMTYASKAPQKQETGPSQMTIYDLQGDVDIVNLETASAAAAPVESEKEEPDTVNQLPQTKQKLIEPSEKKSTGKKGKKEKDKKKRKKSKDSSSFRNESATSDVLKSLDSPSSPEKAIENQNDNDALQMTDEDLAQFQNDNKIIESPEEEIVVRYSDAEKPPVSAYSTVTELEESEAKKKKKEDRKLSKSIQNALKPGKKKPPDSKKRTSSSSDKEIKEALSGPEMGFKPQFKTNPLQKIPGLAPPTPPPTPATGASIAPSEETPQSILDDVDEEDDDIDEDDNPYDSYSAQNDASLKRVLEEKGLESTNKKLLGDALDDLSGAETPPQEKKQSKELKPEESQSEGRPEPEKPEPEIPESSSSGMPSLKVEVDTQEEQVPEKSKTEDHESADMEENFPNPEDLESSASVASVKEVKSSPKLRPGIWPPPTEDSRENPDNSGPPLKTDNPSVLMKWQPKEWKKEVKAVSPKPSKLDISSWAKNMQQVEVKRTIALQELEALKKPVPKEEKSLPPPILPKKPKEKTIVDEVPKNKFVALKPVRRKEAESIEKAEPKANIPVIKLKKTQTKKAEYDKPDTELASGASDELMKYLKGRQN